MIFVFAFAVQSLGQPAVITVISPDRTGTIPVVRIAGAEMLALDSAATFLGARVRSANDATDVVLEGRGRSVELSADKNFVTLMGGRLQLLSSPVRTDSGRHFVPLDFLSKVAPFLTEEKVRFEEKERLWIFGDSYPRLQIRSERRPAYTRVVVQTNRDVPLHVEQSDDRVRVQVQTPYLLTDFRAEALMDGVVERIDLHRLGTSYVVTVKLGDRFGRMRAVDAERSDRVVLDLMRSRVPVSAQRDGEIETVPSDLRSLEQLDAEGAQSDRTDPDERILPPTLDEDPTGPANLDPGSDLTPSTLPGFPDGPAGLSPRDASPTDMGPRGPSGVSPRDMSKIRTVTIDPGHGGSEAGAEGKAGALEKNVTLSISRKLRRLLQERMGVRVFLTRDSDSDVELDQRAAAANSNKSDLFLSIHADASRRGSARGSSVYFQSPKGGGEVHAQRATRDRPSDDLQFILWDMAQVSHLNQSARLAEILQQELYDVTGHEGANRGIKQNTFIVLMGANMPAVLIEVGFISNPDEETLLGSSSYQDQLAEAIYQGVLEYKQRFEGTMNSAGANRDR